MSTRRSFFQYLAAAPLALLGVRFAPQVSRLPIDCDLSMTSLQWAINFGRESGFGVPKELVCDWSLSDVVRHIINLPQDITRRFISNDLLVTMSDQLSYGQWKVKFERGIVESQGP